MGLPTSCGFNNLDFFKLLPTGVGTWEGDGMRWGWGALTAQGKVQEGSG